MNLTIGKPKATPLVTGSLSVDLLPPSERERRDQQILLRRWGAALIAAIGVVAVLIGGAYVVRGTAARGLADEQSRTASLYSDLANYADVTRALSDRASLRKFRSDAAATDLNWRTLSSGLSSGLAPGAVITTYKLIPGRAPATGAAASEIGLTGTLTVESADVGALSRTVQQLRKVKGILYVDAGDVTLNATAAKYSMVVVLHADQTFYTNRYAVKGR
jgi:hypothetical protein